MKYFALLMSDPVLFRSHFTCLFEFCYWRSGALAGRWKQQPSVRSRRPEAICCLALYFQKYIAGDEASSENFHDLLPSGAVREDTRRGRRRHELHESAEKTADEAVGLVGGGIGGGGDGFFDGGVEVIEGFDGFGIVFDLAVESFEGEVGRVFGDEVEAFGGEGSLVDAGPGVGEAGEVGGVGVFGFGGFAEGIEQERIHEVLGAGGGFGGRFTLADGGGEVVGGTDDAEAAFAVAFGLFVAPVLEVGVIPGREGDAEVADQLLLVNRLVLVGGGPGPGEGKGFAGFEAQTGDIVVGGQGEEPFADLLVLPAVVEVAVELVAEGLGEQGEAGARFPVVDWGRMEDWRHGVWE